MPTFNLLYLCAPNDSNGNPRRAWFEINDFGRATGYWLEGYVGTDALPKRLRNAELSAPRINVAAKEFKSWIKSVNQEYQVD